MVGRWIAVALMTTAALGGPVAGPWAAAAGSGPGCSDGVCVCAHHAREQAAESAPCHGAAETQKPRCEMRAACHHELPGVTALPPYLLPMAASLAHEPPLTAMAPNPAGLPRTGLRPVEPHPPRAS